MHVFEDKLLLHKVVQSRDCRYDGQFFFGVVTTGIYCRPICPAKPKMKNLVFFRSAAEAEKAGYRACLRCRPDTVPHSAQWNGTAALVGRTLALISRGGADDISLVELAAKLGVTDTHLRRKNQVQIGASP